MAQIPTSKGMSRARVTTEAPGVDTSPSIVGSQGQALANAADDVGKIAAHFQAMQDKTQSLKALTSLTSQFNKIHGEALQDPDLANAIPKARDKMVEAINQTSDGIFSDEAKVLYKGHAALEMERRYSTIQSQLLKKQIDDAKSTVIQRNDQLSESYYQSTSDQERAGIQAEIKNNVSDAVNRGFMSPTSATKYLDTTLKNMHRGQVKSDMLIDPEATSRQLQKGPAGLYPELDGKDRTELIRQSDLMTTRRKYEGQQVVAIAQNQAEAAMLDDYWKGGMTAQSIEAAHTNGQISTDFASKLTKAIQSPNPITAKHTDAQVYMDLVDSISSGNEDPKVSRQKILDAVTAGKITNSTAQRLYTAHTQIDVHGDKASLAEQIAQPAIDSRQRIIDQDRARQLQAKQQNNWLSSAVSAIKGWAGNNKAKQADMVQEFYRTLPPASSGEAAVAHASKVIGDAKIQQGQDQIHYKLGDHVTNPHSGENFEVIGFNDQGKALVKRVQTPSKAK